MKVLSLEISQIKFGYLLAYSYLCTRVRAVRALSGREGVGQTFWNQRLTTLCFWSLERRKFKDLVKNNAEWMLRVGI